MADTVNHAVEPDERVKVGFFRLPGVSGEGIDPVCGQKWNDHGWIDRGDHGFTVCPQGLPWRILADDEIAVKVPKLSVDVSQDYVTLLSQRGFHLGAKIVEAFRVALKAREAGR